MKTIREYAAENGFEIVGKLTRKNEKHEVFDYAKGKVVTKSVVYWEDEAGNTYTPGCIVTLDGMVI